MTIRFLKSKGKFTEGQVLEDVLRNDWSLALLADGDAVEVTAPPLLPVPKPKNVANPAAQPTPKAMPPKEEFSDALPKKDKAQ